MNTRIASQAQPPQPAQTPSQVQEAPPTRGQQSTGQPATPPQDTSPQTATPPAAQQQTPTIVIPAQGEYAPGEQTTTTVTPSAPNDPTGPATALVVGLAAAGAGAASRRNGSATRTTSSDPSQGVRGGFSVTHIGQTDGDQTLVTMTDPSSPTRYDFDASQVVPEVGSLQVNPDQTVSILDASGNATGDGFSAPWARDASGAAQPTQFTAQGTTLTQTITPRPDAVYPVTADPNGIADLPLAPPTAPIPEWPFAGEDAPWEYNLDLRSRIHLTDGTPAASLATVNDAWKELNRSFNANFPMGGAPAVLPKVGDRLPLEIKVAGEQLANFPVEVTQLAKTADEINIEFVTLPGHVDGPDSTIHFRFFQEAGELHLGIHAVVTHGPGTDPGMVGAPLRAGYTTIANVTWQPYIDRLVTNIAAAQGLPTQIAANTRVMGR